jgi:hypothetical protein
MGVEFDYEAYIKTIVDANKALLENGTYGLSALNTTMGTGFTAGAKEATVSAGFTAGAKEATVSAGFTAGAKEASLAPLATSAEVNALDPLIDAAAASAAAAAVSADAVDDRLPVNPASKEDVQGVSGVRKTLFVKKAGTGDPTAITPAATWVDIAINGAAVSWAPGKDTKITGIKITTGGTPSAQVYRIVDGSGNKLFPYNDSTPVVTGEMQDIKEQPVIVIETDTIKVQVKDSVDTGTAIVTELDAIGMD